MKNLLLYLWSLIWSRPAAPVKEPEPAAEQTVSEALQALGLQGDVLDHSDNVVSALVTLEVFFPSKLDSDVAEAILWGALNAVEKGIDPRFVELDEDIEDFMMFATMLLRTDDDRVVVVGR